MALGDLFKKQEGGVEHFWSLVIGRTWVQAAIWRVVNDVVEVVSEGNTASWQEGNEQSLVEAADGSLSAAAAAIPDNVTEPSKVVFGLAPSWAQDGTIVRPRLDLLKKLSDELELSPAGFVVIPEAITHYLKTKEGAPLNAILVGLAEDTVDVTLVQNGNALGTVEIVMSISLGSDVSEGLSRLPEVSQYPSRILLYNHKVGNLEDARQNLLGTDWEKVKIGFLHTPKVEILRDDIAVASVSLAGGAEVGQAKKLVFPDRVEEEEQDGEAEEAEMSEVITPPAESDVQEVSAEELGFLQGKDVAANVPEVPPNAPQPAYDVGQDLPKKRGLGVGALFSGIASIFSGFRIPTLGLGGAGVLGVVVAGLVLAILVGGLAYWYLPKAQVTIFVTPKKLEKTLKLTVDPKEQVINQAKKIVPGTTREASVQGEKTTSTTGERTVGDRARGQVTILHVGASAILKAGTALLGPNSLKFTLDNDTTVASGSSLSKPSKTQSLVTAANIGSEHNLASGSEFAIGNFSKNDFVATNDNALSGGTSRSVSAVAEEDRANLEKELTAELLARGLESLKKSLPDNEVLIAESATLRPADKTFSHKAGDETQTLKLSLSGKIAAIVVPRDAVDSLIMADLEKDVPTGFALRLDQVQVSYSLVPVKAEPKKTTKTPALPEPVVVSGKALDLNAQIVANLLPKINPEETARAITGKYPDVAREYLATIPGFTRAKISLNIGLPGKLGTLPRIAKNITIEVASER